MTPAATDKRRLADLLLPGGIDSYLRTRREQRQSWRAISIAIREEIDLDIHPETLRLWFTEVAA